MKKFNVQIESDSVRDVILGLRHAANCIEECPQIYDPKGKHSAVALIYLGDYVLRRHEFYGYTESEVKASVESWARNAIAQISTTLNSAGLKL